MLRDWGVRGADADVSHEPFAAVGSDFEDRVAPARQRIAEPNGYDVKLRSVGQRSRPCHKITGTEGAEGGDDQTLRITPAPHCVFILSDRPGVPRSKLEITPTQEKSLSNL